MKKSNLEIYALCVCFATVVCLVIALGIASYSVIEIIYPEFTLSSYDYNRYQSNDAYWKRRNEVHILDENERERMRPNEEELTKQRLESYQIVLKGETRDGFQSFTKALIVIFFDVIFFVAHWWVGRRAREANAA